MYTHAQHADGCAIFVENLDMQIRIQNSLQFSTLPPNCVLVHPILNYTVPGQAGRDVWTLEDKQVHESAVRPVQT